MSGVLKEGCTERPTQASWKTRNNSQKLSLSTKASLHLAGT